MNSGSASIKASKFLLAFFFPKIHLKKSITYQPFIQLITKI